MLNIISVLHTHTHTLLSQITFGYHRSRHNSIPYSVLCIRWAFATASRIYNPLKPLNVQRSAIIWKIIGENIVFVVAIDAIMVCFLRARWFPINASACISACSFSIHRHRFLVAISFRHTYITHTNLIDSFIILLLIFLYIGRSNLALLTNHLNDYHILYGKCRAHTHTDTRDPHPHPRTISITRKKNDRNVFMF